MNASDNGRSVPSAPAAPPAAKRRLFGAFADEVRPQSPLRAAATRACRMPEPESVARLLAAARVPDERAQAVHDLAARLAGRLRARGTGSGKEGLVQGLLQEFALSSQEGIALMCLTEALLRIPDAATRDALIRDKIGQADWKSHLGQSQSLFVNAATWGLLLTGRLVATHTEGGLGGALSQALARGGEPIVRKGVDLAMRLMGEQFVTGETIAQALANARRRESEGFRYSYDMLGEAALTDADAQRYLAAYTEAIHAIGRAAGGRGVHDGPGFSLKLSALHPRFCRPQRERVMAELYPRLEGLALLARQYDIGLNIDAEEVDRLDLSLDLLERLCAAPALAGWNGIGFVVQAYQKRAPFVVDVLIDLARRSRRRLMVRLVKGAYWDSEIKRAQVDGMEDYAVFTRKVHTDVCYLACARGLLAAPEAVFPQFATHNAHTLAAVYEAAGADFAPGQYEFQCLHGMGEPLYEEVIAAVAQGGLNRPCRIYAPVGTHETLLAYLVRRLLENGSNSSFVNRIADAAVPIDELIADPVATVERTARDEGEAGRPHPDIPLPRALFGAARINSSGVDLGSEARLAVLASTLRESAATWRAAPMIGDGERVTGGAAPVLDPADRRIVVGEVFAATAQDVADALAMAMAAAPSWQATPVAERAAALERAAGLMEAQMDPLVGLIVREAGKTFANAVGEVREAVDFLRYYALEARVALGARDHEPLGVVACISPWNFPLAIFTGQVAAALVAGNAVVAKPAEQTPLIAAQAVRLLRAGGVPGGAVQLLPGRGETVGAALVADVRVRGVLFTGSNEVARLLQRSLAGRLDARGRLPTLIAETGGQNAMIVDSSALPEQVVADVLTSAFDSAGQRCSALRVLCLQDDVAEKILEMLRGAMRELVVGPPDRLATDVGPVIDAEALHGLEAHVAALRAAGRRIHSLPLPAAGDAVRHGCFMPPTLIELERVGELTREVFGPVLHAVRYRREGLGDLVDAINATGYGLTLGIHSRIDETIEFVTARARAGNVYVNRNMIGAVVGVQPFGGEALSGTGPKAGGPLYLRRLVAGPAASAQGDDAGAPGSAATAADGAPALLRPLRALRDWLAGQPDGGTLAVVCDHLARASPAGKSRVLPGPTGERNTWTLLPRPAVLCIAEDRGDLLVQLATVLAAGAGAVWLDREVSVQLRRELPAAVRERIALGDPLRTAFDAALIHADGEGVRAWSRRLAQRDGPIVGLQCAPPGMRAATAFALDRLLVERTVSVNTAAAGGNASLMTIG